MKVHEPCLPVQDPSGGKGLLYTAIPLSTGTPQLPLCLILFPQAAASLLIYVETSCQAAHPLLNGSEHRGRQTLNTAASSLTSSDLHRGRDEGQSQACVNTACQGVSGAEVNRIRTVVSFSFHKHVH